MLAIDFGTSNTAAAVPGLDRLALEPGGDTLPTAVFFPARGGAMRIGRDAAQALTAGEEGRYLRALKSVLGTPLLHEPRLLGGKRRTLADVVTAFLAELRARAGAAAGRPFTRALSGRPVHFHPDPARDARAQADLEACYRAAGFTEVRFLPEPEAAALACQHLGAAGGLGLVVDIGGGTSDFSVYRPGPGGLRILASHGIRLGGTDFDQAVSLAQAMPLLGLGSQMRREMGPGLLPVPRAIYAELADWAQIPFLYTPETRREAARIARLALEPRKLRRLVQVLTEELGHDLAFAVERGKIAANAGDPGARIDLGLIEPGLAAPLAPAALDAALAGFGPALDAAAAETLARAGVPAAAVDSVILVGGSSLMGLTERMAQRLCPQARLYRSEAFTAVVDGLALAAGR